MKEPKEILLMCAYGEVFMVNDDEDMATKQCRTCRRTGCFTAVCEDCHGTEQLGGQICHRPRH